MHVLSEKPPEKSLFHTQNDWAGRGPALSQNNIGVTDMSPRHMIFRGEGLVTSHQVHVLQTLNFKENERKASEKTFSRFVGEEFLSNCLVSLCLKIPSTNHS